MPSNNKYNLVAENPQSTVVAEYMPDKKRAAHYQSEADLEHVFIEQLQSQAYEYLPITAEADLVLNLRRSFKVRNLPKSSAMPEGLWELKSLITSLLVGISILVFLMKGLYVNRLSR